MLLTPYQQTLLSGERGPAVRKAMQILVALGEIYAADALIPIASAQIAGVSYDNLGDAGLEWLTAMADGGGVACVPALLNPAGMDVENWQALGIPPEFAQKQQAVIAAFTRMGITPTCTCTPYLAGNLPQPGEHLAWAESSAVCYANAVLGARTNREGGPSALAAALTGFTPNYGYHRDEQRAPDLSVVVESPVSGTVEYGALGRAIGEQLQTRGRRIPFITGLPPASPDALKSFCASIATYGGAALFHIANVTPEAHRFAPPAESLAIARSDIESALAALSDAAREEVDFVSLGCPHLSIEEIARIAALLAGRSVTRTVWITTSRPVKRLADERGYTAAIEASGAKFAVDTCCVVAPIKGRFRALATDSAKACYYAGAKNQFKTLALPFDDALRLAVEE